VDGAVSQPTVATPMVERGGSGRQTATLLFADYGMNIPSQALIAHNDTIAQNPDMVRRFLAATLKGWEEAEKDPKAAAAVLVRLATDPKPTTTDVDTLQATLFFARTDRMRGKPFGIAAKDDLEESLDVLSKSGMTKTRVPLTSVYTDAMLPK